MTSYVRFAAQEAGLHNVHVRIMDVTQGLGFEDETFDIIHSRFGASFLKTSEWPRLLEECRRIMRPGGMMHVEEAGTLSESTSAAAARLNSLFAAVLRMGGHTFAPAGDFLGTPAVLSRLMEQAGWKHVRGAAHLIEGSYGKPAHRELVELRNIMLHQLHPVLVKSGLITEVEFARLAEQLATEANAPEFCAMGIMVAYWGIKEG